MSADSLRTYPPAPWDLQGEGWLGLFPAERLPEPPPGCVPVGREVVLILNRYRAPLVYDELAVGVPVRNGARVALWVPSLWVDSEPSRAGGRAIWSLPKELARFTWRGDAVEVRGEEGEIAALRVRRGRLGWPMPLYLPALSLTSDGPRIAHARGSATARAGGLHVERASDKLLVRPDCGPRLGLALQGFRIRFPAPSAPGRAAGILHSHAAR